MFAAMPGLRGGALMLPIDYLKLMSQRLWDLGARPVEEPTLEWVPPAATDPNWITSPGRWVPVGSVEQVSDEVQARAAMAKMSGQQKAELRRVLEEGEPFPDTPSGVAASALQPSQREVVLSVLKEDG